MFASGVKLTAASLVQVGGRFYFTANQTITQGTTTKIEFDTVEHEQGSGFDAGNNRYVAPTAGKYLIMLQTSLNGVDAGKRVIVDFLVNGTTVKNTSTTRNNRTSSDLVCRMSHVLLSLAANDYVECTIWHESATAKQLLPGIDITNFSVIKLL